MDYKPANLEQGNTTRYGTAIRLDRQADPAQPSLLCYETKSEGKRWGVYCISPMQEP